MNTYVYNERSPIPHPKLNGGLFTGTPFTENAPWGNIYVRPTELDFNYNLKSTTPGVEFQMQNGFRPGNNSDYSHPSIKKYNGNSNYGPFNDMFCIDSFDKCGSIFEEIKSKNNCKN